MSTTSECLLIRKMGKDVTENWQIAKLLYSDHSYAPNFTGEKISSFAVTKNLQTYVETKFNLIGEFVSNHLIKALVLKHYLSCLVFHH